MTKIIDFKEILFIRSCIFKYSFSMRKWYDYIIVPMNYKCWYGHIFDSLYVYELILYKEQFLNWKSKYLCSHIIRRSKWRKKYQTIKCGILHKIKSHCSSNTISPDNNIFLLESFFLYHMTKKFFRKYFYFLRCWLSGTFPISWKIITHNIVSQVGYITHFCIKMIHRSPISMKIIHGFFRITIDIDTMDIIPGRRRYIYFFPMDKTSWMICNFFEVYIFSWESS